MTEMLCENAETKLRNRAQYWHQLYTRFLKDEKKKKSWKLRAVCYHPWPLLFNRVMVFFEYGVADRIFEKNRLDLKAKTVLDVGCGAGRWCEYFWAKGAKVIGADLVPELLAENQKSYSQCDFLAMSAAPLACRSDLLDFINAAIVLEYVPNSRKPEVIREFFRVLRPGGCALILDPVAGADYREGESSSLMKPGEWRELFIRNGFEIMDQRWLHAYPLTRLYKAFMAWIARIVKWIKGSRKANMARTSPAGSGGGCAPPVKVLKTRHQFYHAADQMVLRVIACFSFPLEFLWLALGREGSHLMFLIRKKTDAQKMKEGGFEGNC